MIFSAALCRRFNVWPLSTATVHDLGFSILYGVDTYWLDPIDYFEGYARIEVELHTLLLLNDSIHYFWRLSVLRDPGYTLSGSRLTASYA